MGKLGCALIAVIVAWGVSACSEDADGDTPGPSSSGSTTSAMPSDPTSVTSPTSEAPKLPENAKGDSAESAAHFVEYYVKLMNHASATGDTALLERYSDANCKGCNSYIKLYRETYANGGYFKDSGWKIDVPVAEVEGNHVAVLADVTTPDTVFKLKEKDALKKGKGGKFKLRFESIHESSGWRMSAFERQAKAGR